MKTYVKAIAIVIAFAIGFFALQFLLAGFQADASSIEEIAKQSEALKTQAEENLDMALRLDCLRVSARIGACYEDQSLCQKLWDSEVWFAGEWGADHSILCSQSDML